MQTISFEKTRLSNGLDVILHEDHSLPVVAVNVWYHVGSKDEIPGKTGYAHLFEHLMFEGSKHHDQSYFEPLMQVGANLNGSTNLDRTNYWENVPVEYLELALWLESDRMGFLLDALDQKRFDIQRDVVKNERRQSYENRPYGMAGLRIQEALYPLPHTYHWPTIGYHEDLDIATVEDAHAFFQRFYTPSNASLSIAGDIDTEKTRQLVERYFGDLPPGDSLVRTNRADSPLGGPIHITLHDKVLVPRLYLAWPAVARFHEDEAALAVLADILGNGKSSRLHRILVHDKRIAQSVGVSNDADEVAGDFGVEVTAAEGHATEEIEAVVRAELERMKSEPPTSDEMARANNRIEWARVRQMATVGGFGGKANRLNSFNVFAGDPDLANRDMERFLAVQPEDVIRVARAYVGERVVRLQVLPEPKLSHAAPGIDRTVRPAPASPGTFQAPLPQHHRLSNGLQLLVVEKREVPLVAFGVIFETGAAGDPASLGGISSLTTAMLQEGTTTRSSTQIADEFEFLGSQLLASTGREYTLVGSESLTREFPRALELVSDLLQHPTFPEEELVRLSDQRQTSIRRQRDNPTALADLVMPSLMHGLGSPYGHPVEGSEALFQDVTKAHLLQHYQGAYGPGNATLAVVGDVSMEEAVRLAEEHFAGWQDGRKSSVAAGQAAGLTGVAGTMYLLDKPGAAQSVIRAGSLGVERHHPDYFPLTVFNHLFGGQFTARLNRNLRQDKGYSYGYRSAFEWQRPSSRFVAGGSVQTDVTAAAVSETLKEFAEVRGARPVSEEEFDTAKSALLRQYPSNFESGLQVLQQLAQIVVFGLPLDYHRTYAPQVEGVSLADVHRVVQAHIEEQPMVLVVGDGETIEPSLAELGLPIGHVDHEGREV